MFQFPRMQDGTARSYDAKKVILLGVHLLEVVLAISASVIFALEAAKEPKDVDLKVDPTTTTSGTIPVTDSADELGTTESAITEEMEADKVYVYFKVISALFGFFAVLALTGLYSIIKGMKGLMRSRTDVAIALNLFAIVIYILTIIEGDDTKFVAYFLGFYHVFRIVCSYFEVIHSYEESSSSVGIRRKDGNIAVTMSAARDSVTGV